jgi:Undecaprenyl-phosphate glucose phosphotransferase
MKTVSLSDAKGAVPVERPRLGSGYLSATPARIESLIAKIATIEFFAVAGVCLLTSVAYFKFVLMAGPPTQEYVGAAFLLSVLVLLPAFGFKQYVGIQAQSRDRYMWSGLGAVTLAFSLFLSLLFLLRIAGWYSRGTFFCQFAGVGAAILIVRGSTHSYVRRAMQLGAVEARRVVLVGDTKASGNILDNLRRSGIFGVAAVPFPVVDGHSASTVPTLFAEIRKFVDTCREHKPDDILFLAEAANLPRIAPLVDGLSELPTAVHVIPTGTNELWASATIGHLGGATTIQVLRPPLSGLDLAIKRGVDVCVAGVSLLLLLPLLCVISLAIKMDSSGPVMFRQRRHGYNNEVISMLKFRTMTVVESGETTTTFTQVTKNDARVTRFGRILRRFNLDELPQLINVLWGEMSIVGPRPHPIALNAIFKDHITPFWRRHNVKPGLTGWAQVHGLRGETDTLEKMRLRVDHDLHYIENWSLALDLKIILMTLFSKSSYQNAY